MPLKDDLKQIIIDIKAQAEREPAAWRYYDNTIVMMNQILRLIDEKNYDQKKRTKICAGVGRALMDRMSFTESLLGDQIFNLMVRFEKLEDQNESH